MLQSTTISKICKDLSLFEYSSLAKSSFSWYSSFMNSSTMEKFSGKFEVYFFKEFEFLELGFHGKLEFQNDGRPLYIFKTVVDC